MDIRLSYTPGSTLQLGSIDLRLDGASIETGRELETSVLISLFTDRRARKDDRLPTDSDDLKGWWADTFPVKEGDTVKKGDTLVILEAMKMENALKSTGDATVKKIVVKKGQAVEKNTVLIQLG